MNKTLAFSGGEKTVPDGMVKPWPPIDDVDKEMVLSSLTGDQHSFGPNCKALQEEFAAWNGNKFAITTNSGTAALHMCVAACECGVGTEVIVPAYSWSSSVTCVLHHNALPVFVDIDFDTMNLDVGKIEEAITERTKAILVVHLHGLSVEMDSVMKLARKYRLKVIEDCCQAHGAKYQGKKAGTWGDCAAFSCNQNKLLCSGDGGLFVTDNEEMFKRATALWSFGEYRAPTQNRDYHAYALGWMYRNNDMTAAFGRAQLSKLDSYLSEIKANAAVLDETLQGIPGLILPTVPEGHEPNWYNYVIRFDSESLGYTIPRRAFRDKVVQAIAAEGVPMSIWQRFILPAMNVFQAKNAYGKGCPWECQHARGVDYVPARFPVAQRHCDTHTCFVMSLRPPNGVELARRMGEGVRKVMENLEELDL